MIQLGPGFTFIIFGLPILAVSAVLVGIGIVIGRVL